MSVLASKIADDAGELLFDPNHVRFTNADLLGFINAGQNQAAILKPDISISNAARQLAAGTKQSILSTSISFLKLTRNMGTDGETPGAPIHLVDMELFGIQNPTWHTDTASATVQVYMFDENDPKHFYVYPQQPTSSMGYVEEIDCVPPTEISAIGNAITIDDIYENALLDYVIYRALMINAKQSPTAEAKALHHYNLFVQALTGKNAVETNISPKAKRTE